MKTILEMRQITKEFPGVKALDEVNFQVREGEIHCLVGENGAGKSTLMKVLSGVHPYGSYTGDIVYDGEVKKFYRVNDSESAGIGIIYQELALIPELSVYENIYFGNEVLNQRGLIDWNLTRQKAEAVLAKVGLNINPETKIKFLGVGQQQLVEIAKALSKDARLLILDEPTAALNDTDSDHLLKLMTQLKEQGVTLIMISHKLKEVMEIADSITILRDGHTIRSFDQAVEPVTISQMIQLMVGREIKNIYPPRPKPQIGKDVLEVSNWTAEQPSTGRVILRDISFHVRQGEVVGIAGLMGAGRTELALSLFGNTPDYRLLSGEVKVDGVEVKLTNTRKAIEHGLAYLTEDRKGNGLILIQDIKYNMSLANLDELKEGISLNEDKEIRVMQELSDSIGIKAPSIEQKVLNLSGGNQQKVVIGKWMFAEPEILILDEPTRGIDVGAKYEIYQLIYRLASEGKSVVLISSELPEILNLCDRIYVMSAGRMAGELSREEATDVKVMELATRY